MAAGKHFFACTTAALPALPEAPGRKGRVFLSGTLIFEGTWQVMPGNPGRKWHEPTPG